MKKRLLSLVLVLCLVVGLIPAVMAAEVASGKCGPENELTWTLTDDGTMTFSGNGPMGDFGSIGTDRPWHSYASAIKKVIIQDGVTSIGSWAFLDCANLTSISIADSVTNIDYGAFENCASLSGVVIPDSVTHICNCAFYNCSSFHEITIPVNANVCDYPFDGCDSLKAIHVAEGNPYLCSDNGVLLNLDKTYLIKCPGGYEGHYIIPNTVTEMWLDAFSDAHLLTGITIPSQFSTDLPLMSGNNRLEYIEYADGTTTIGELNWDYTNVKLVHIPNTVTTIVPNAFSSTRIADLTIPASVTRIGEHAFESYYLDWNESREIRFEGDAPAVYAAESGAAAGEVISFGYSTTAYYPAGNPTWTPEARNAISSTATWIAHDPNNPFLDVPADSFYYNPVMWAIEKGITNGLSATEFGPNAVCNRAQVVTFLWRAAGSPEPTSAVNPFVDVQAGSFYEKPVLWAVEKGITNGSDATHFGPTGVCNRAQVVTFLYRAFGSPAVSTSGLPFTDVPAGSWYEAPIAWAVANGVTNGLSATEFGPNASCNRAQVVTFLYRAYND